MVEFSDIKGFTFDLDGVITDTAKFHEQAWHALATELSLPFPDELARQLKGISRMDSLQMILDQGDKPYTDDEKANFAARKNKHYVTLITGLTPNDILPGMFDFIADIKQKGYVASIASASKNAPTILKQLGLTDYFIGIVVPSTLAHGKPNPEIYIKAGELLKLAPQQIIGLEDASAGVKAIQGAGQTALGIGPAVSQDNLQLWFADTASVTLDNIKQKLTQ